MLSICASLLLGVAVLLCSVDCSVCSGGKDACTFNNNQINELQMNYLSKNNSHFNQKYIKVKSIVQKSLPLQSLPPGFL